MDLSLVLLGSNFTKLLWFKGGWFLLFLQLRGKWCLLIFGVFPKQCWLLNYFISKKHVDSLYMNRYFINAWCAHCLFVLWKNLWDNLNLFKLVCVNISLYFLELWKDYFCEHIEMCFENLWQVVIKSSVLYLVLSKGRSYCS